VTQSQHSTIQSPVTTDGKFKKTDYSMKEEWRRSWRRTTDTLTGKLSFVLLIVF
jgi:hypothetical protein